MTLASLHRTLLPALATVSFLVLQQPASAEPCANTCARGRSVCVMQARTAYVACLQSCAAGDPQCAGTCRTTSRTARATCQATRDDCKTTCPPRSSSTGTCAAGCSATAKANYADAVAALQTCVQNCKASGGSGLDGCLKQCAVGLGSSAATSLAAFQGCLAGCQGEVAGVCFSTTAMECTTESCGPGQPCSQPNEFCSERCATPSPSGTCFDSSTLQCTDQTCSPTQPCPQANQTCLPTCPPPLPQGKCFDTTTKQCTDQSCDRGHRCTLPNQICTLQCPPPTPVAQCSSVPCGGACILASDCPPGAVCPELRQRGQCAPDANGNCGCVPVSPRPTPTARATPTPQCQDVPCGGTCTIGPSCRSGEPCPEFPTRLGQCTPDAAGNCACVPMPLPTPSARPTCASDADCDDANSCTADHCVNGKCEHACVCVTASGTSTCCRGPGELCVPPCGADAAGTCGGVCPPGADCEIQPTAQAGCGCVSGAGGPCGGNVFSPPPVCASGLVCQQRLPDAIGVCVTPNCVPLFASGCSQTSDCCVPCGNGTRAPCAVCLNGTCVGAP